MRPAICSTNVVLATELAERLELRVRSRKTRSTEQQFHAQVVWMDLTAEGRYSDPKERTRENFWQFLEPHGTFRNAKRPNRSSIFRPTMIC
jgi:hypothetical protein